MSSLLCVSSSISACATNRISLLPLMRLPHSVSISSVCSSTGACVAVSSSWSGYPRGFHSTSLHPSSRTGPTSSLSISSSSSCNPLCCCPFHSSSVVRAGGGGVSVPSSGLAEFLLADIGEGIAEVEVIKWFVKVGDTIAQFDPVCEVQSDKATVPITSRFDGKIVELKYQAGQIAKVGKPLLIIEIAGGAATESDMKPAAATPAAAAPAGKSATHSAVPPAASASVEASNDRFLTSPAVRRLAKEENVDLSKVSASGPGGRILKEDVLKYLANKSSTHHQPAAAQTRAQTAPATATASAPAASPSAHAKSSYSALPQYLASDISHSVSGLARIMVQTMNAANAVPTFGYADEINVEELVKLRESVKVSAEKKYGIKLTFLPFLIKAASLSLKHFPMLNAHANADCSAVTHKAEHNIGLAVDTPRGLIVPNIKNVQNRSILEIGAELQRISTLAQQGKLGREDLTGGTFTLSNIGSIGGTYMRPILVVPEVMIGALGSFQLMPRYDAQQNLKPTRVMNISWSGDHRVLDGATVARFSNQWKSFVENPYQMLAELK